MPGEFLGHDEGDVAAAEAGDEEDAVGVEVGLKTRWKALMTTAKSARLTEVTK